MEGIVEIKRGIYFDYNQTKLTRDISQMVEANEQKSPREGAGDDKKTHDVQYDDETTKNAVS